MKLMKKQHGNLLQNKMRRLTLYFSLFSLLFFSLVTMETQVKANDLEITAGSSNNRQNKIKKSIDAAHNQIWSRFIDKHGIVLDYTDLDGKVIIPTAEDCELCKPNARAWWTPIENGAFFNGLYIDALCNKWNITRDKKTASEIKRIVNGLLLLESVHGRKGFIARGVALDGKSHYPLGSNDQTFPWVYGLWKYLQTDIPSDNEKKQIVKVITEVVKVIQSLNWRMPCEKVNNYTPNGGWKAFNFSAATRMICTVRILSELTKDKYWTELYHNLLNEKGPKGKTRLEILAEGDFDMKAGYPWIHAGCQAALKELSFLEKDESLKKKFKAGLLITARQAAKHIGVFKDFDNNNNKVFTGNWRVLNKLWKKTMINKDDTALAIRQGMKWHLKISPRIHYEKIHVMNPLFACWIVLLSGEKDLIDKHLPIIEKALLHFQWEKLYYATMFAAENVYYEIQVASQLAERSEK